MVRVNDRSLRIDDRFGDRCVPLGTGRDEGPSFGHERKLLTYLPETQIREFAHTRPLFAVPYEFDVEPGTGPMLGEQ